MAQETKKDAKARIEAAFREHWPDAQANWQSPVRGYVRDGSGLTLKDARGNPLVNMIECVIVREQSGNVSAYALATGHGVTVREAADKALAEIPKLLEKKHERDRAHEQRGERLKKEAERARHVDAVLRNRCSCEDCKAVGMNLVLEADSRLAKHDLSR